MRLIDADAFKKWLLENSINEREEKESRQIGIWIDAFPTAEPDVPDINVGDMISRQEAIDALDVLCQEHRYKIPGKRETYSQYNEAWQDALDRAEGAIGNLPSAQPERLADDDFETIRIHLNAYKEKLCNQRRWEEAEEYQRIIGRFMAFASAQPERKKGKWTTEEVAEILFNAFGDDCACNFNGIDEWLPERCKYTQITDECPEPKEKHGCWMQFLLQGGADVRGTGDNSDE